MGRRYPAQIVAMCKEDMAAYVKAEADAAEESTAGELRKMVGEVKRLRAVARTNGLTADEVLTHLEKSATAAA